MSDTRTISPWWALLLVPVALALGLLVGRLPAPAAPPEAPAENPLARIANVRPGQNAPFHTGAGEVQPSESPKPEAKPEDKPKGEYSSWTTLASATSESQRNGKPILIDFSADWCGPCQRLKQNVFESAARGQIVQTTVIPVSIVDRAHEDGRNPPEIEALQQQYQVDGFPTLVVYSPQTGKMVKTSGYGDPERTLQWITEAAQYVR